MTIDQPCQADRDDPTIVLAENGRKVRFLNPKRKKVVVVTVDGCAITEGKRCDYLLLSADTRKAEQYVELKGGKIEYGLEQLETTIEKLGEPKASRICFLIAKNVSPTLSTMIQNKKKRFRERFQAELVIKSGQCEHTL